MKRKQARPVKGPAEFCTHCGTPLAIHKSTDQLCETLSRALDGFNARTAQLRFAERLLHSIASQHFSALDARLHAARYFLPHIQDPPREAKEPG